MAKAFIFDFDGVIFDTESKRFNDLKLILKEKGIQLEEKFFFELLGKKTKAFLAEKFPELSKTDIEDIAEKRRELQFKNLKDYKLILGIKELLLFLKSKNYSTAITTGSELIFVETMLKDSSMYSYFDIIVAGEDFKSSKPDPECYKITLNKLKLNPKDAVVVEDSEAGVEAAKSIGCTVFAIQSYKKVNLSGADQIFKDHFEILKHLKHISSKK